MAQTATVKEVIRETPSAFLVRLVPPEPLHFRPGQYVLVHIDEEHIKPYSIASPPSQQAFIELCIRRIENGFVSNFMYNLRPGTRLPITGPSGAFTLKPVTGDVVFLATGTGISSLKGMIDAIFEQGTGRQVWLFFGNRTEDEIIYRNQFEALSRRQENFHFIPCLSRASSEWDGERGYAQEIMKQYIKKPQDVDVYICGVAAMVEEASTMAKAMNFKNVYLEKYV